MNKYTEDESKSLLDIGCGNGFFLEFMVESGWEAIGIEPSPEASEHARSLGHRVFNTTLEEFVEVRLRSRRKNNRLSHGIIFVDGRRLCWE